MSAMAGPRSATRRIGDFQKDPVKAAEVIYRGAAVCLDSNGELVNASATTGLITRGVARDTVDNTDDEFGTVATGLESDQGVFEFFNKSGDELSQDEVGDVCYWEDNQTVCKTSTGKSVAGVVASVDANTGKVSVHVGMWPVQVGLLAAQNLADVSSAATARANLGVNVGFASLRIDTLAGAGSPVYRMPLPDRVLTITKIKSIINGALTTADAVLTCRINTTNITGGAITVTQAASAAGDQDEVTPSAANVTDGADDYFSVVVSGTQDAAVSGVVTIEYTF